nr:reverse transcriptase domain-containing protein [Tanacetum cinerariifolium]
RRNLGEPSSLFDFEEVINNNHNQEPPPQNGPPPMVRPNGKAPRMMEELCQPSINGRGRPIAPIPIQATDFGLRHHMIQQVQNTCQFHGLPGDDANRRIDKFLEITQHMKQYGVSDDTLRLSLFPYSLTHHAIACHRDTINAAAGGTFMQKTPKECYEMIENMTAHHNHWDTSAIRDETSRNISSTSTESPETCGGPHSFTECPAVGGYTQETAYATTGRGNNFNQTLTYQTPTQQPQVVPQVSEFQAYMKANDDVMKNMQTQMTSLTNSNLELKNMFGQFMKMDTASSSGTGSLPSNIVSNPREDLKVITTWSGITLAGPTVSPPHLSKEPSPASTSFSTISSSKMPGVTKDTVQPNTLLHMPKFALMFKSLLNNKEKLFDLATILVNENCAAVILKKLPEKLGDPGKFFIPCDFPEFDERLALVNLGMSINLMPLSIWKKISFPELTSTQMILELADRSMTRPAGIAEDVFVKVGKFHFPTDFVVVDYVVGPRVPLILGRPFLQTGRAMIDVYGEELTLRVDDEAITFKLGGNFILEEIEACLTSELIPPRIDDTDLDLERDIRLLEELLSNNPSLSPLPPKELNIEEIKTVKSSIDEPPELELNELPSHLEYA